METLRKNSPKLGEFLCFGEKLVGFTTLWGWRDADLLLDGTLESGFLFHRKKKTPSIWLTGYGSRMGYHCTHIQRMKIKTIGVNSFEPYMRNIFGWVKSRFSQVLSDKYLSSQAKLWQNCCVQNWGTLRYSSVAIFQILHRNFDVFPIQTSISWLEFSVATLPDGYPKTIHVLRDGRWKVRSPTVHQLACWSPVMTFWWRVAQNCGDVICCMIPWCFLQ